MKKLFLALALLLAPSAAFTQCNGVFPNNTVCGNVTGGGNLPRPTATSAFPSVPGGSNGQIQYNNSGALGGLTDTQVTTHINSFTSTLSGAAPLSGGGTTNFLRADGTWTAITVPQITVTPQARITLVTGTPVMATSQTNVATVIVTPFGGNLIPIYDGTNMNATAFAEVSQAISDTTKSPAATVASSIYDIFCWTDSGTNRCTRGFPWTNDTTPCANCGITLVNGIYVNTTSITNGPAAQRGTWMGMIRTNSGNTGVNFTYGSIGSGGVAGDFSVYNYYNQVPLYTTVQDNTNSWTYAVSDVWRAPNGNATMRVSNLRRFASSQFEAKYVGIVAVGAGATAIAGVGLNSTTTFCGQNSGSLNATVMTLSPATCTGVLPVGYSFVSALEWNDTTTASTWRGLITGSATPMQSGFHFSSWQ